MTEQFFAHNSFSADFDNVNRWRSIMALLEHDEVDADSCTSVVPETKSSRKRQSSFFIRRVEDYRKRVGKKSH